VWRGVSLTFFPRRLLAGFMRRRKALGERPRLQVPASRQLEIWWALRFKA